MIKIASAPTRERLVTLLQNYWYSTMIKLDGEKVFNAKGEIPNVRVIEKKGRFTAIHI